MPRSAGEGERELRRVDGLWPERFTARCERAAHVFERKGEVGLPRDEGREFVAHARVQLGADVAATDPALDEGGARALGEPDGAVLLACARFVPLPSLNGPAQEVGGASGGARRSARARRDPLEATSPPVLSRRRRRSRAAARRSRSSMAGSSASSPRRALSKCPCHRRAGAQRCAEPLGWADHDLMRHRALAPEAAQAGEAAQKRICASTRPRES